ESVSASHALETAERYPRLIVQLFGGPDGFAGHLVESYDARSAASRRYDNVIAVNQRRFTDQPFRIGTVKFLQDVPAPDNSAVGQLEARKLSVFGERIQPIAVCSRRAPRPGPAILTEPRAQRTYPDGFAVGAIQTKHRALTVAHALHQDSIAFYSDRAVAFAKAGN